MERRIRIVELETELLSTWIRSMAFNAAYSQSKSSREFVMAKSKPTAPCSGSHQHRRARSALRFQCIVAAWLCAAVMSETVSAQSCDAGPGSDGDSELYPSYADTDRVQHYFDGGLLYLLSNNVQWDIWGGLGLNDHADDYFFGSGLSVRYR